MAVVPFVVVPPESQSESDSVPCQFERFPGCAVYVRMVLWFGEAQDVALLVVDETSADVTAEFTPSWWPLVGQDALWPMVTSPCPAV